MDSVKFTRQDLYDLVWSETLTSISKKYNLTVTELSKLCKKMEIPIPGSGYWSKLQFGKNPPITPLPSHYSGDKEVMLSLRGEDDVNSTKNIPPAVIKQKEIEKDSTLQLKVPDRLHSPHKLVSEAHQRLKDRLKEQWGLHHGLTSTRGEGLEISVSPKNIDRAVRFMDTMVKLFYAKGFDIEFRNNESYIKLNNEKIRFRCREKLTRVIKKDGNWERSEYEPTGILAFQIDGGYSREREWKDGKEKIEEQISKIISKIEIFGIEMAEESAKRKIQRAEEEEKARIRKEFEQKENELVSFKKLLSDSMRWKKAMKIREYLKHIEKNPQAFNRNSEEFKSWLTWARGKVDWYDPSINTDDELLKDIDKETLAPKKTSYW